MCQAGDRSFAVDALSADEVDLKAIGEAPSSTTTVGFPCASSLSPRAVRLAQIASEAYDSSVVLVSNLQ